MIALAIICAVPIVALFVVYSVLVFKYPTGYTPPVMRQGYQPTSENCDWTSPPQGGSGVPPKAASD